MTKTYGTYVCACGMSVSLSGMAYRAHDRGRAHAIAMAKQGKVPGICRECGVKIAGERDTASPFCGTCDQDGAKHFDLSSGNQP